MWLVAVLTVPEKVVKAIHYRGQDSRYQGGSSGERQDCHFPSCFMTEAWCIIMSILLQ